MWEGFQWNSANMMQHLAPFVFSEGKRYQALVPDANLVTPNRTHEVLAYTGWAYCARTDKKDYFLAYYEKDCPTGIVRGALPLKSYKAYWFNPREGKWTQVEPDGTLTSDRWGRISIPKLPTQDDWGLKLVLPE
jgi:hypothetical protein